MLKNLNKLDKKQQKGWKEMLKKSKEFLKIVKFSKSLKMRKNK